jgi:hypothetical protein
MISAAQQRPPLTEEQKERIRRNREEALRRQKESAERRRIQFEQMQIQQQGTSCPGEDKTLYVEEMPKYFVFYHQLLRMSRNQQLFSQLFPSQ